MEEIWWVWRLFLTLNIWRETRASLGWQVLAPKIIWTKSLAGKEDDLKTSSALGRCSTCWDRPLFIIIIFYPLQDHWHVADQLITLQPIFDLCISKKELAKPHAQIWSKYLQNRIWKILSVIWHSVENCNTRCSNSAVSKKQFISKRKYEISVVILWWRFI
jgi:hypothetical protein